MDAYRPDPDIEKLLKLVLPSLNKGFKEALEYTLTRAKYFVSFEDFTRILLDKLEEKMKLPDAVKGRLWGELEKIYNNAVQETILEIAQVGKFIDFRMPDTRSVEYALKLHDFYLGKFFRGDKELRKRVLNWISEYYLQEGNPIGRGQKGIKEFLKHFKNYIQPQTEWKARQIIDTSVNFLRNAGKIRTLQHARVEYYRWDATNDRLTCKICRSYDGRIFRTADAVRILDALETTQDPELIRELKPFVKTVQKGKTSDIQTKMPPIHSFCRCRVVAQIHEEELPIIVEPVGKDTPEQRELLEEYRNLTRQEITNKIEAHLGSSWGRMPAQPKDKDIENYLGRYLQKHFVKHGKEVGASSIEEYKKMAYNIIKKPSAVYVERNKGGTYFIYYKGDMKVVCSNDNMAILSLYRQEAEQWIKKSMSAIIRIL